MAGSGSSTAISGDVQRSEITPLSKETVETYGHHKQWDKLRQSLEPVISRSFAVAGVTTKAAVDDIRGVLDSSATESQEAVVRRIAASDVEGDAAMLKAVLEAGADPDIPNKKGWRASHFSSLYARLEVLEVLYLCRPDMAAVNDDGDTPLKVALTEYRLDASKPWRSVLRPLMAEKIKARKYDEKIFPTIAELACRRKFYAVRNVIRREVVPAWEYPEKFHGKSAAEWARAYGEQSIAQEIEYFAKSADVRIREEVKALQKELAEKEVEMVNLRRLEAYRSAELKQVHDLLERQVKEIVGLYEEVDSLKKALADKEAAPSTGKRPSSVASEPADGSSKRSSSVVSEPADESSKRRRSSRKPIPKKFTDADADAVPKQLP